MTNDTRENKNFLRTSSIALSYRTAVVVYRSLYAKTKQEPEPRRVELSYEPPTDIESFWVEDLPQVPSEVILFRQHSFKKNKMDELRSSANVYYILMEMRNIRGSVALI